MLDHAQSGRQVRMPNDLLAIPFYESFGSNYQKVTVGGFLDAGSPQLRNDRRKLAVLEAVEPGECTHPEIAVPAEVKALDRIAIAGTRMVKGGDSVIRVTGTATRNSCQAAWGAHPQSAIRPFRKRSYKNRRSLWQNIAMRAVLPAKTERPFRSS